jgi:error-prone DNA polymerase
VRSARSLGLPEPEVDDGREGVSRTSARTISARRSPRSRSSRAPTWTPASSSTLFRVAERLNGFPRHLALHPSGIVLSSDDLVTRCRWNARSRATG